MKDQSLHAHFIRTLFDPSVDTEESLTHLQYIECQQNPLFIDQLTNKLSHIFYKEIIKFGHDNFKEILKFCPDRRILMRLIKKQLTFDQFITKVICETQGFVVYCKDDLIEKGISKEFFDENAPEVDPLAPYGA